jgi:hypothetical protein
VEDGLDLHEVRTEVSRLSTMNASTMPSIRPAGKAAILREGRADRAPFEVGSMISTSSLRLVAAILASSMRFETSNSPVIVLWRVARRLGAARELGLHLLADGGLELGDLAAGRRSREASLKLPR